MRYSTPLRYPGGKSKLTNFVKQIIKDNGLLEGHYVEPFAGGAGVALSLLFQEYIIHAHINDLNKSVYSFWYSVINDTEDLCKLISDTQVTMQEWQRQRSIQSQPNEVSTLELGFSTFFLNRTNRSGIITGGVIGGKNQNGEWKIDDRYNKQALIDRIKLVAYYKSRISIYNEDASSFLLNRCPSFPSKTLIYLDPPYYVKGKHLYEDHYTHDDHDALSQIVKNSIQQYWMVSYDFVPEIAGLYKEYRQIDYQLTYSAADRYKGAELMVFDDRLQIPDSTNPPKMKAA